MRGNDGERIHDYLVRYIAEHGYAPTVREIGWAVGIDSTSVIVDYLDRLNGQSRILVEAVHPRTPQSLEVRLAKLQPPALREECLELVGAQFTSHSNFDELFTCLEGEGVVTADEAGALRFHEAVRDGNLAVVRADDYVLWRRLHERAAAWFAAQQNVVERLDHAIQADFAAEISALRSSTEEALRSQDWPRAQQLIAEGLNPRLVMEHLRHSQSAVTMNTYAHILPAIQRQAADAMDRLFGA